MSIELVVLSNITSSVALFSSCPQSFPAPGSFPMSWLFASGGQSIGVSASASVLPKNIQGWFPLGLTGFILLSKGLARVFSKATVRKHKFFGLQPSLIPSAIRDYWKTIALAIWILSAMWCLWFLIFCLLVIAFIPRSKCLLISWLQSPSEMIFGAQENKVCHCFHCFPIYLPWSVGTKCHDLNFWYVEF